MEVSPSPGVVASVCVPTYGRPEQLARTLRALAALEPPDGGHEVVVVDDGSPDGAAVAAVLEEHAAGFTVPFRWYRLATNAGAAAARNHAWRHASGQWVAFTDDDCQPEPGWLRALLATGEAAGADVVQGRTIPDPARQSLLAEPFARSLSIEGWTDRYETANIAYRRTLLEALDGFDEGFRLACDDTDLGWRAAAAGAVGAFAPDAVVAHDVVVRTWHEEARGRRRWIDTTRVIRRHPDSRRLAWTPYVYRRSHVAPLVALATSPLLAHRRGRRAWLAGVAAVVVADVVRGGSPAGATVRLQQRLVDTAELATLAVGSVRNRTLLL